ncbi:hypothetical protein AHAS_Ahas15G0202500 [Arachis hypogaea]
MEMTFSANALQQLEILKNNSDGSENGSLLQILNCTLTIFGSRLLRHWVSHPLCDQTMISACLHAVSEIAESMKHIRFQFSRPVEVMICDGVVVASLLNATLVILKFLYSNVWNEPSNWQPVKHSIECAIREKAKTNGCNSEECRVIHRETEAESRKREIGKKGYGKNVCGTII